MATFIWIIIIFLFIISLIGVIVPFVPDTLPLWLGVLLYRFILAESVFPLSFWLGMILITIFIIGSDILTNIYFVKRYGGSRWAIIGAALGVLIGTIFLGPIGIIIGPLLAVFLISLLESEDSNRAFKIAMGTIFAFFTSSFVKLVLQVFMISWFFLNI